MRRSTTWPVVSIALFGLVAFGCSKKRDDKGSSDPLAAKSVDTEADDKPSGKGDAMTPIGVEAGGIQREANEGPAAVITAVKGQVEVRRVGETEFKPAKAETKLYAGDVIRAGAESGATIALADESLIELAEVTTIGIASRQASADPASAAAVLAGLARFTVSARAPGEGAFRVYTPTAVVLTKGTVYGVGVAATGQTRIGVEQGAVDVIGLTKVESEPVALEGGSAIELDAQGSLGKPAAWPNDDWGAWRDNADASVEATATVQAHGTAMAALDTKIREAYTELDASADSIATFEANAAVAADKGDTAAYQASLPDGAATIEASFSLAGRIDALTWAYVSHATLATDIYVRYPKPVEVAWVAITPRIDAAILWPKRYEVTALAYFEPLHTQYYVHHPRGRMHASLVGFVVPEFYAKVEAPAIDPVRVRGRIKTPVWIAPDVHVTASARPIWVTAPPMNWRAKLKVSPAPFRANVGWYVRPPTMKAKLMVAAAPSVAYTSKLHVAAPAPRASLHAAWKIPVGMKVKVAPPNLDLAAKARASWKVGVGVGGGIDAAPPAVDAKAKVKGKLDVAVPDPSAKVKVAVPDVKAGIGVKAKAGLNAGASAAGDAKAGAGANVKVKAPEVKVKAPEVKVKGEAKAKLKVGF